MESFQHEIGCRILRVPKFYSRLAVRIGLHWPAVSTRILIRKLGFLSKLLSSSKDTISSRVFTSLAIEDVFETSIVQQCRMLESNLGTNILAQCLTDPENATHTVKSNKDHLLDKDYSHLLFLASHRQGSTVLVAHVASQISWRRLWDIALDRGVKGTRTFQSLFKELSRPISCFKCSQCGKITDSITCFEHACTSHPNLLEDLSCKDLISALGEGNSDSIFDMCSKMSNCHSLWNVDFSA